jgi:hypothetical protein
MPAMPARRARHFTIAFALLAALMQLWLGAAHGLMREGLLYCGDGNIGRGSALIKQLPAELRVLLADRGSTSTGTDCKLCAPLCSPAVPTTDIVLDLSGCVQPAESVTPVPRAPASQHTLRPPVRAPPHLS